MKSLKKILLAAVCVVLFSSCSPMRFSTRSGQTFERRAPLEIVPFFDETVSGASELMYLLQMNGYNIVSRAGSGYYEGHRGHRGRSSHSRPQYSQDGYYVLDIFTRKQKGAEDTYASFRATLSDAETGHIILTASIRRPTDATQTVRELVRRMNQISR